MALRHRAFLLDAAGFKRKAMPILMSLDAGNVSPLYAAALTVVQHTESDKWVLNTTGSSLLDITKVNSAGLPLTRPIGAILGNASAIPSSEIGYWLLLLFSAFLLPCPGMGENYSILNDVLRISGWSENERLLLFEGRPTSVLLKPDTAPVSLIKHTDPYWYWMVPRAHSSGWLSQERISQLYTRLVSEREFIHTFDARRFGNPGALDDEIALAEVQRDYLQRLRSAFQRCITMLEKAQEAKAELYMVISD